MWKNTLVVTLSVIAWQSSVIEGPAFAQDKTALTIGYVAGPTAYVQYGDIQATFKNALNADIVWKPFDTQADLTKAISSGAVSIAVGQNWKQFMLQPKQLETVSAIGIASQDFDSGTCLLSSEQRNLISTTTSKFTVGLPEDRTTWPVYLKQLAEVGLTTDRLDIVEIKPSEAIPALTSSRVEIGCGWETEVPGPGRPVGLVELMSAEQRDVFGAADTYLISTNNSFASANPDLVSAFLQADIVAKTTFKTEAARVMADAGYSGGYYTSVLDHTKFPTLRDQLGWNEKDAANWWAGYATSANIGGDGGGNPAAFEIQETFLVTDGGRSRGVDILYATDRLPQNTGGLVAFGSQRSDGLSYGVVRVTVPEDHRRGAVERPWEVALGPFAWSQGQDPAKHFILVKNSATSKLELISAAADRASRASAFHNQVFVFVHGFRTDFDTAAYRTAQIVYDMRFDGTPIFYSWASGGEFADYVGDRDASEISARHLAGFLTELMGQMPDMTVNIICHSMGCNTTGRAVERLKVGTGAKVAYPPQLNEVVFAAPDVDRGLFLQWLDEMGQLPHKMTLYASAADKALMASKALASNYSRAGDAPPEGPVTASNLDSIDITALGEDIFAIHHDDATEMPILLNDIALAFSSDLGPPQRFTGLTELVNQLGQRYWRY